MFSIFNKYGIRKLILNRSHKFDGVVLDGLSGLLGGDNGGKRFSKYANRVLIKFR